MSADPFGFPNGPDPDKGYGNPYLITLAPVGKDSNRLNNEQTYQQMTYLQPKSVADIVEIPARHDWTAHRQQPNDVMGARRYMIISPRVREVLDRFELRNVEFFPAEVSLCGTAEILPGYWLMNCYNELDIIDFERSQGLVEKRPKQNVPGYIEWWVGGFDRLVLTAPKIDDHLFLITHLRDKVFISPEVRVALTRAGVHGGRAHIFSEFLDRSVQTEDQKSVASYYGHPGIHHYYNEYAKDIR